MSQPVLKTKKRKHPEDAAGSSKRTKTEKVKKDKSKSKHGDHAAKKDKGKGKADGEFSVLQATLSLSIPPVFANLREGAEEMLDSMVMKYVPTLRGVVLAHDNLRFLDSKATIKEACPFANCTVSFDATVWNPRIGMELVGKVNLCSPDHVSLLVHRTFNVSIPRHHIPAEHWEFEYGPAENDPEYGTAAAGKDEAGEESVEAEVVEEVEAEDSGRWVHKVTGAPLGGANKFLKFTVIGLTIANQMLSLVGSIQPDPFSPEHVPDNSILSTTTAPKRRPVEEQPVVVEEEPADEGGEEDEVDAFEMLGRMGDEAERKAKESAEKKERKRKRKEAAAKESDGVEKKKRKKTTAAASES